LLEAYQRVAFSGIDSIFRGAASFYTDPPHAPTSTFTAMVGYYAFGPTIWGPYIANIWVFGVFVTVVFVIARSRLAPAPSMMLTTAMAFAPVAHAMITEFRPDMGAGAIFGFAIYLLLTTDYEVTPRPKLILVGLAAAAAIIAKPSACIISVPMVGLSFVLAVLRPGHRSLFRGIGPILKGAAITGAAALTLLIPAALILGKQTAQYIYEALVVQHDIWATPGDRLFHWTYHAWGPGGSLGLGGFFYIGLLVIGVDLIRSMNRLSALSNYKAASFYLAVTLIYCGMATSAEKTGFQGSFFYVPFLFATTLGFARLTDDLAGFMPSLSRAAPALFLLAVALSFPAATLYNRDSYSAYYQVNTLAIQHEVAQAVLDQLRSRLPQGCKGGAPIITAIAPEPITPESVALEIAMTRNIRLEASNIFYAHSAQEIIAQAQNATFVLIPNKWGVDRSGSWNPSAKFLAETSAALGADRSWRKLVMSGRDPVILFARTAC
jgi:hypothetical protein